MTTGSYMSDKLQAKTEALFQNAGGLVQQRNVLAYNARYSSSIGQLSEQQARNKYFELLNRDPTNPLKAELEIIINRTAPAIIAPLENAINEFRTKLANADKPITIIDTPLETITVPEPTPIKTQEINTVQQTDKPITIGSPTPSGNQTFVAKWEDYFADESKALPKFTAQYHEWEWK